MGAATGPTVAQPVERKPEQIVAESASRRIVRPFNGKGVNWGTLNRERRGRVASPPEVVKADPEGAGLGAWLIDWIVRRRPRVIGDGA